MISSVVSSVFSETFPKVARVWPITDSAVRHTCLILGPLGLNGLRSKLKYLRIIVI